MVKRLSQRQEDDTKEEEDTSEPPLSHEELVEIRWVMFGKCPHCGFYVKAWSPGPFNPAHYKKWEEEGRDGLTGHGKTCEHKYLRSP